MYSEYYITIKTKQNIQNNTIISGKKAENVQVVRNHNLLNQTTNTNVYIQNYTKLYKSTLYYITIHFVTNYY